MKFLDEIRELVSNAIAESKCNEEDAACTTYSCNDGYIDIWCDSNDNVQVFVYHDDNRDTGHPNMEKAITDAIPCWDDVVLCEDDYDMTYDWRYC